MDGVLIACVNFKDREIEDLVKSDIPLVTIDYRFPDRLSVESDNYKGVADLVKYVYSQGHRKIAYIYGVAHWDVTDSRLESFRKTT